MSENTEAPAKNAWDEKELGCLWRREKQSTQEKYLTGVLKTSKLKSILAQYGDEDIQLVCFTNKNKAKDTHPDLRIYLSEKRATTPSIPSAKSAPAPAPKAAKAQPKEVSPPDDLI